MRKPHEKRREEPKKTRDPEMKDRKGDGMKEATKEKRGTEKGRVMKGKEPSMKSDGMKVAMRGEAGKKGSKLTSMRGAEMKVR